MSDNRDPLQMEIDSNLAYFLRELPNIPAPQRGRVALLRHQAIVDYFDTIADAISTGSKLFQDNMFSVQKVANTAVSLGFYSYAVPLATTQ